MKSAAATLPWPRGPVVGPPPALPGPLTPVPCWAAFAAPWATTCGHARALPPPGPPAAGSVASRAGSAGLGRAHEAYSFWFCVLFQRSDLVKLIMKCRNITKMQNQFC